MQEGYLDCEGCKDAYGTWKPARRLLSDCASFMNLDGELLCTRSFQENAPDVPAGPYTASCGGCSVYSPEDAPDTRFLACMECADAAGNWHLGEIDITAGCDSITNENGVLTCVRAEPAQTADKVDL